MADTLIESKDSSSDDSDSSSEGSKVTIFTKTSEAKVHSVYLYGSIGKVKDYVKLFKVLENSMPYDTVQMFLNSPGGDMDTGIQIISHIRRAAAKVNIIVTGQACSMAALLAFTGDTLEIEEDTYFLFHNYSASFFDKKGRDIKSFADFQQEECNRMLISMCSKILTADEIRDIYNDREVYISSEEAKIRLRKSTKGFLVE